MRFGRGGTAAAAALIVLLGLAPACAKDDGATVRNTGSGGGSGAAGSGSGAAGSGSAAAEGSASADAPRCENVGDPAAATTKVGVRLSEWEVVPAQPSAPAGKINFHIDNTGKEPHEMVVVRATDPAGLPTSDEGAADEDKLPKGSFIGEVEPFPGGSACDGTFELSAGSYVLFCNVVEKEEDGTMESHYRQGMRAAFTVT